MKRNLWWMILMGSAMLLSPIGARAASLQIEIVPRPESAPSLHPMSAMEPGDSAGWGIEGVEGFRRQRAIAVADLVEPGVEQAQPRVWFQKGQQVLWWIIKLKGSHANEAEVYLDGHTGDIFTILKPLKLASSSKRGDGVLDLSQLQPLFKAERVELIVRLTRKRELAGKVIGGYTRKANPRELDAILKEMKTMVTTQSLGSESLGHIMHLRLNFYAPGKRVYECGYAPKRHYLNINLLEPVDPKTLKPFQRKLLRGKNRWVVASAVLKTEKPFERLIRRMARQWDSYDFGEP